jgi:hypothetical protein
MAMNRHRRILVLIITALLLGSPQDAAAATKKRAAKADAKPDPEKVASAFQAFCEEWMHKLAERERDNISHLKWEQVAGGVESTYVGYDQQHTCKLMEGTEADPVAKVFYREVHYTKRGPTIPEAEQSPAKPTQIFEVQEIFHYLKGKWDF